MKPKNKKVLYIVIILLVLLSSGLTFIYLGNKEPKLILSYVLSMFGNSEINLEDSRNISYKNNGSELTLGEGTLPKGFPSDFPISPNSKIISGWETKEQESSGYSIVLETDETLEDVYNFYKVNLVNRNWNINSETKNISSATISFEKDKSRGFVGISTKEGKVEVLATIGIID